MSWPINAKGNSFGSFAVNWSMDVRGGNRLLDHPLTFLSKQQLNLLSFSLLTSCSEKKRAFQLLVMEGSLHMECFLSTHVVVKGGGRKEVEKLESQLP